MPTFISNFYHKNTAGFVFLGSVLLSVMIATPLLGLRNSIAWTSFSVMYTYSLYNAKADASNLLNVFCWLIAIIGSAFITTHLHLSWAFYCYLLVLTYCYYYFYGVNPVFDRAMKFVIIFSTIGTAFSSGRILIDLPIGALIGTTTALIICHFLMRKKNDLNAFTLGGTSHDILKLKKNLIVRSVIYSCAMFMSLLIPQALGLGKIYWATLTFIMLVNPKSQGVFAQTVRRFIGSVLAVLLLYAIFFGIYFFHLEAHMITIMIGMLLALSFIFPRLFVAKDYTIVTFGTTCYSLTLVELAAYWYHPNPILLYDRIAETLIGGTIAIIVGFILKKIR